MSPLVRLKRERYKGQRRARWTMEQIRALCAVAREGVLRAALIAAYTGLHLSDVIALRWEHVTAEGIRVTPRKTARTAGTAVLIPLTEPLAPEIARWSRDGETVVTTRSGEPPYTADGFETVFRRMRDCAGLPKHLVFHGLFHGLRHTIGSALAEAGGTPHEIAAVLGHTSTRMAEIYTAQAMRDRLAATALGRLKLSGEV